MNALRSGYAPLIFLLPTRLLGQLDALASPTLRTLLLVLSTHLVTMKRAADDQAEGDGRPAPAERVLVLSDNFKASDADIELRSSEWGHTTGIAWDRI